LAHLTKVCPRSETPAELAEQLPAELGAVDLVIIDEASQSDVTELPALLRGKNTCRRR
jgi:hypothetical protein